MKIVKKHNDLIFTINNGNQTIDDFLKTYHLSKAKRHLYKQNKMYLVNNEFKNGNYLLKEGDKFQIQAYFPSEHRFKSSHHLPDIVYEDDYLLIVNKKAYQEVYGSSLDVDNCLVNDVAYYYEYTHQDINVRYIQRLDKETSGLVLFVKCEFLLPLLDYQISTKQIHRYYYAFVEGDILSPLTINKPIARDRHHNQKMRIDGDKYAITHIQVIKRHRHISLVECLLETGRTHQIRVHLASISHPLIGDLLYNKKAYPLKRQALHAYKLKLIHPITHQELIIETSLPQDLKNYFKDFN